MSAAQPATSGAAEVHVEVRGLTKRFGGVLAVDELTFSVLPGRVTGFLGPNGAGKTTTLRMALGLVTPTAGSATIGGLPYADLVAPQRIVGAALEATGFHPGRTGRNHLRILATTAEVPERRVDEVLAMVGLTDAARRRTGEYSLGMRQRLGLAGALLADPRVLLLDEPANGLDPEGIAWLRGFLRYLAAQGRTVLVSSHVLSEVQQTVDDVVIISRGRLVRASTLAELEGAPTVLARSPRAVALVDALRSAGLDAALAEDVGHTDVVRVTNGDPAAVGHAAYGAGIELHELRAEASDLERIFLQLTADPADPGTPS